MKGPHLRALHDALLEAFDISSFDRMLRFQLDKQREHIATGSLTNIVFETIATAQREGWLLDLVSAARTANPTNNRLREAAEQIENQPASETEASTLQTQPELSDIVNALADTDAMSRFDDRNDIVSDMRPEIRDRIHRRSATRSDIRNIVKKAMEFDSGLLELVELVREYEGDTAAMRRVEEVVDGAA